MRVGACRLCVCHRINAIEIYGSGCGSSTGNGELVSDRVSIYFHPEIAEHSEPEQKTEATSYTAADDD